MFPTDVYFSLSNPVVSGRVRSSAAYPQLLPLFAPPVTPLPLPYAYEHTNTPPHCLFSMKGQIENSIQEIMFQKVRRVCAYFIFFRENFLGNDRPTEIGNQNVEIWVKDLKCQKVSRGIICEKYMELSPTGDSRNGYVELRWFDAENWGFIN